ncbi:hypothetical protein [Bordetella holmesii]|nr:hypothetical protein [Bordetella holmesii]
MVEVSSTFWTSIGLSFIAVGSRFYVWVSVLPFVAGGVLAG